MTEPIPPQESSQTSPTEASDNFLKRAGNKVLEVASGPELTPVVLLVQGAGIALALERGNLGVALFFGTLAAISGINAAVKLRQGK